MMPLFRKWLWFLQRRRKQAEIREELEFHLEEETEQRRETEGLPMDQAKMDRPPRPGKSDPHRGEHPRCVDLDTG